MKSIFLDKTKKIDDKIFTKMGIWKLWYLRRGWWAERLPALTVARSAAVAHRYKTDQSLQGYGMGPPSSS
jgi:hypothetical protein